MRACPGHRCRRGVVIAHILVLWGWAGVEVTRAQPAETPEEKFLGAQPDVSKRERVKPFSITVGPEGAVLRGDDTFLIADGWGDKTRVTPYATVLADANWSPRQDALDNASLTLQPSLGVQRIGRQAGAPVSHGAWFFAHLDFRQRKGDFKDQTSGRVLSVNQTILGAGVEFKLTPLYEAYRKAANKTGYFNDYPRIDVTYYGVAGNSEPAGDLPDEIVAHHVQVALRGDLRIPACWRREGEKRVCPLVLQADYVPVRHGNRDQARDHVPIREGAGAAVRPAARLRAALGLRKALGGAMNRALAPEAIRTGSREREEGPTDPRWAPLSRTTARSAAAGAPCRARSAGESGWDGPRRGRRCDRT